MLSGGREINVMTSKLEAIAETSVSKMRGFSNFSS